MPACTEEQETVIQISRNSDTAKIWTSDTLMIGKLNRLYEGRGSGFARVLWYYVRKNKQGRAIQ